MTIPDRYQRIAQGVAEAHGSYYLVWSKSHVTAVTPSREVMCLYGAIPAQITRKPWETEP